MSFDRIRADLRRMEEKQSAGDPITGADLFSMIRDLCEDIRTDTGAPVEKHPAGDTARLLQQLPWMGRLISRQYRQIEGQVMDTRRQEELTEKMRELDRLTEQLELQAGETAVLEDKRKALRAQQAALESDAKKKLELQQECNRLEEQIRVSSQVTLPQLESSRTQLEKEKTDLDAQLEQTQTATQTLRTQVDDLRQQCDHFRQETQRLTEEKTHLEQQHIQTNAQSERATAELMKLRQEQTLMTEQLEKASRLLETGSADQKAAAARLEQLRQTYQETLEQCREAEDEADALAVELETMQSRKADLLRSRDNKATELEQLRQALGELDGECARLQQQLDQLTHDLADKDREQAKQRLAESIRQREQALTEYQELEIQIKNQQQAMAEQVVRNESVIRQNQELKWQAEQEAQKTTERIIALQKEIAAVRARQEQLSTREMDLKQQIGQLEEWLRSLELEQYTARLEQMRQRNELLLEARAALEVDLQHIMAAKGVSAAELDPKLFQASFRDTENWITHHQKLFSETLRLLSATE